MANLEQSRPQRREGDPELPPDLPGPAAAASQISDADLDSVLDEIDDCLLYTSPSPRD